MTDKTYDMLKTIALVATPVIVFLSTLLGIWDVPYQDQITQSLAALDVLFGAIVVVAKDVYDRKQGFK